MFTAHIGAMDCFALALRRVATLHESKVISNLVADRYSSYDSGIGASIEKGSTSFADLEKFILGRAAAEQEPKPKSGQQEKYELIFNNYLHGNAK
jgi:xylose isomerase